MELQTLYFFMQSFQGDLMCSWRTTGQREPLEVPKLKVVFAELGLAEQGLCVQD